MRGSGWRRAAVLAGYMLLASGTQAVAAGSAQGAGSMVPVASAGPGAGGKLPKTDIFKTVAAANAHCPGGIVVWSSLSKSKSFHLAGSRYYGTTKHGGYVCKSDALAFGFHPSRS